MARKKDYRPGGKKAATADGFMNFAARLGLGQDNLLARGGYRLSGTVTRNRQTLEAMYRDSWVVGRMVDVVAEDMVRGGIDIQAELPPGDVDRLQRHARRMGVWTRLSEAIKWGRLYGGALAVILIAGDDISQPLDVSRIGKDKFRGLYVLDRYQVNPSAKRVDELGPMLGYPESYEVVTDHKGGVGARIHHTRCIRFTGVDLPWQQRLVEQHWGMSVVERAYDRILALDSATHGGSNLLFKSFLRVIKVAKLREILAAGGQAETALTKMFTMIRQMQSNEGITLLDGEDEFAAFNWTFAGLYDALQAFCEQIAGATGIPLVRLLGQSPKGFATGDSDLRTYYDTIATLQDDDLRPAVETLLPILSRSLWSKPLPEGTNFEFLSLWQPSEVEKSTIATNDAQAVASLYTAGLLAEAQSRGERRDAGRVTGRFTGITDENIAAAKARLTAPEPPEPGENPPAETGTQPGGEEPTIPAEAEA